MQALQVYPNPGKGHFMIRGIETEKGFYSLYNTSGQLVKRGVLNSNQLDLEELAKGPYYLLLSDKNNHLAGQVIILE